MPSPSVSLPVLRAGFRAILIAACVAVAGHGGREARAQISAQTLVGKAVSDDKQYGDINDAIARFRERDIDGCRAMFERARSANAKLPPTGVMMATLWLAVSQVPQARAELEDTIGKTPSDPEPYLLLGDLAFQDRRITDAGLLFDKALATTAAFNDNAKRKRDFEIRANAGVAAVAEARKQWAVAEKSLRKWIELDPDSAAAHQRLGAVLFQLEKPQDALAQFKEARQLDEKAVFPELALARLYEEGKQRDEARKLIEKAAKAAPQDIGVQLAAANWHLGRNEVAAAAELADKAVKIDVRNLDAKVMRGMIARVARDYPQAEKFLGEAHVQSPGNFAASNSLALVLLEKDDKESRQRALEMAEVNAAMQRDGSPNQVNALTTLAWVYYTQGRREDAERILTQISQSNRLTTDGAYYVARILVDRGEKDRARKILEEVLANDAMFASRPGAEELLAQLKKAAPAASR
jgi:tetratricopeptide (TPR) repeat protein